jgi:hypothetical protein
MSKTKSNVHPGHYKVAGRGRQGEDIIHDRQKAMLAERQAMQDHQAPYREHVSAFEETHMPEKGALERPHPGRKPAPKSSPAVVKALKRERHNAASRRALARQARSSARRRTPAQRSSGALKARKRTQQA